MCPASRRVRPFMPLTFTLLLLVIPWSTAGCGSGGETPMVSPADGGADACTGSKVQCVDSCVDTTTDPHNCGACGNTCPQGQLCSTGTCDFTCNGGTTQCGSLCV